MAQCGGSRGGGGPTFDTACNKSCAAAAPATCIMICASPSADTTIGARALGTAVATTTVMAVMMVMLWPGSPVARAMLDPQWQIRADTLRAIKPSITCSKAHVSIFTPTRSFAGTNAGAFGPADHAPVCSLRAHRHGPRTCCCLSRLLCPWHRWCWRCCRRHCCWCQCCWCWRWCWLLLSPGGWHQGALSWQGCTTWRSIV